MTASPVDRADGAGGSSYWVSLVLHDVRPVVAPVGGGRERFSVPLVAFERLLDTISAAGFRGCSVAEAMSLPGTKRVAITFDDGDRGQYEFALPALLERGMKATFYITTDWVGRPGYVTWAELRQMAACGMSIQSHTCSHPFLSELDATALTRELGDSKRTLDDALGQDTDEIAFPGGDPPMPGLRQLLFDSGYRLAVGSRWGRNHDRTAVANPARFLRRCTVRGEISGDVSARIISADLRLAARWLVKEAVLRRLRSTLGASRYARWRRVVLDSVGRSSA